MSETQFSTTGLDKLLKALALKGSVARVGILGDKTVRSNNEKKQGLNNAEVGAIHEFGGANHPQRSFLRVPIAEHLESKLEGSGLADKDRLALVLKTGDTTPWVQELAILAEAIVIEAFATGGYGKWTPWTTPGYQNNTGQILKDTQQLSESITSEVTQ